jgi:glutamyl-tRNA synthetase
MKGAMNAPIVTRFAPSPTGYLHIGGARTALFNYLFAKATGGQFLLRIEDTDAARSTDDAKQAILDGMAWLGLAHDGEVVYQSHRADRHREIAQQLLASGHAYRCYCTPDELAQMREQARATGAPVAYDRRWRERTDAPPNTPFTIRIKAPLAGDVTIQDAVQGSITIPQGTLDDFVLLRADGTPTYMLAVVVDDHDMGISHVIRGDDHLNNAPRQQILYEALGWSVPVWAHIPLIHGPDGAKLSKRHGALGVMEYAQMGFLPEALRNYLLRLGWSHGDAEIISDAQAAEWFNLQAINKAPARFDFAKLTDLNGHYLRAADDARLLALALPHLREALGQDAATLDEKLLLRAMPALKERGKTIPQLAASALFYCRRHNPPEDAKAEAQLKEGAPLIQAFLPQLQALEEWSAQTLQEAAKAFAEAQGIKLGALMAPIRVAITGSSAAPSMFEVMELLGKDESIARLGG